MQIFLSHARSDKGFAKALSSQLGKRGFSVWSPGGELLPGDNIWLGTGEALKESRAMVVLVSPDSMRCENVRREIEYALGHPNYIRAAVCRARAAHDGYPLDTSQVEDLRLKTKSSKSR